MIKNFGRYDLTAKHCYFGCSRSPDVVWIKKMTRLQNSKMKEQCFSAYIHLDSNPPCHVVHTCTHNYTCACECVCACVCACVRVCIHYIALWIAIQMYFGRKNLSRLAALHSSCILTFSHTYVLLEYFANSMFILCPLMNICS